MDVTHRAEMDNWIRQSNEEPPLDLVVIANAGIAITQYDSDKPLDITRKVFDVNVTGVFNTIEPALMVFKERKKLGQIAIISSLADIVDGRECASLYGLERRCTLLRRRRYADLCPAGIFR